MKLEIETILEEGTELQQKYIFLITKNIVLFTVKTKIGKNCLTEQQTTSQNGNQLGTIKIQKQSLQAGLNFLSLGKKINTTRRKCALLCRDGRYEQKC